MKRSPPAFVKIVPGTGRVVITLLLLCLASGIVRAAGKLHPAAKTQIEALIAEKEGRNAAQRKMDSQLVYFVKKSRGGPIVAAAPQLDTDVKAQADSRVLVDLKATVSPDLLNAISQAGGTIVSHARAFRAVRALVPPVAVEALAGRADVQFVEPAALGTTNFGSILSEADRTHRAATARTTLGVDGTGIKIGVLSDGVDSMANSEANGNLNALAKVLPGQAGSGDEGTAMMELIQDLLPGAQLVFATANTGSATFASNILGLQASGCSVIVDDFTYFNESPFQDMVIAQAVSTVSNAGVMYFSSARNSGNKTDGTAGTWEGDFADGGAASAPVTTSGNLHDFGGGVTYDAVASGGSQRRVDLFWADPLGASANDYDLFVLDAAGTTVLRSSTNIQSGTQDPYENTSTLNVGEKIVIVKKTGAANRFLHLDTGRAVLTLSTTGCVRGHNASVATNAFSVAATNVGNSPNPNFFVGGTTNPVETFSSDGPRRMFFQSDGTPLTAGNFSSTGGTVFNKPDITAADGASTSVPGFTSFFGTSAAAPHASAIAAMLKTYNATLTPAQVRTLMASTALDIDSAGFDRDSGSGIAMALQSVQAAPVPDVLTIAETGLNASGPYGGSFTPTSGTYTLTNTSASPVNWTAASTQSWDSVSASSGTLAAGSSVTVTCTLNSAANALNVGPYADTVTITNTGSGFSRQLTVNLNVQPFFGTSGTIPDGTATPPPAYGTPLVVNIPVSGLTANVTNVSINVGITHTAAGDVDMVLASPGGTRSLVLASRLGATADASVGSTSNYSGVYTFTDFTAGTNLWTAAASSPIPAGAYRTTAAGGAGQTNPPPVTSLVTAFAGLTPAQANGTWTLTVRDATLGDTGSITSTSLAVSSGALPFTNADLASLVPSSGSLSPVFSSSTLLYGLAVPNASSGITVTPTTADSGATVAIKVNGTLNVSATSGSPSGTLPLNIGINTLAITSTAASGATKTYTVLVTRADVVPQVVLPSTTTGTTGTNTPLFRSAYTLQFVYSAAYLTGIPSGATITGLSFRLFTGQTTWPDTARSWTNYDVQLSKSLNSPGSLSTTLANNIGPDVVTVRSGAFSVAAGAYTGGTGPNPFGPVISFTTPYTYTGGDLLVTIRHKGNGTDDKFIDFVATSNGLQQGLAASGYTPTTGGSTITPIVQLAFASVAPTLAIHPTVSNVGSSTATLGGSVSSDGGAAITERGFVYSLTSTNGDPYINGTGVAKMPVSGTTGTFTVDVSGLALGGNYSFKAYAINAVGTTYSNVASFSTSAATLSAGDVVVTGWSALTNTITFMPLVDLPAGTVLKITDEGWFASNAFSTDSNGDGTNTWTTGSLIAAGTHLKMIFNPSSVTHTVSLTTVSGATDYSSQVAITGFNSGDPLPLEGDGIFLYQDSATNPFFIFGFNNSGSSVDATGWNTSISSTLWDSLLPGGTGSQNALVNGVNAIGQPGSSSEQDNVQYTGPTSIATRNTWLSRVANRANWSGDNTGTITTSIGSTAPVGTPTTTITSLNLQGSASSNAATVNWSLAFGSATTGVMASQFSLSGTASGGTAIGTPTTADGGITWTVPVTTGSSDGTLILSFTSATGISQNISTTLPFAGQTCTMDKTAPTVTASPSGGPFNSSSIVFTLTFSEAVTGLTTAGITVTNGTKGTFSGSGSLYTLAVTPSGQGSVTCKVNAAAAQDAAGNGSIVSNTASMIYDSVLPTASVTSARTATNTSPITFTLTFSEAVTGLTAAGIDVTNGTQGALSGSGTLYTIPVTPIAQGPVGCAVSGAAAQDAAGNGNVGTVHTVVYYDTVAPTLSPMHIASSNSNSALAKTGNTITLTFISSETIQTPVVTIAGQTATASNVSGNSWSASTAVSAATAEGVVPFNVSFSDVAGNAGTPVTSTSDASAVRVDRTVPTVASLHLASSNATSTLAKPGDVLSLTFTASESLLTPSVTLAGQAATLTNLGSNTWSATTTVSSGTSEGLATFAVAFSDLAGNAGITATSTSDGSTVTVDHTAPSLASVHLVSGNSNPRYAKSGDTLTLTFTASEAIRSPTVTLVGQAATVSNVSGNTWRAIAPVLSTTAQGNAAFTIAFTDVAGNAATAVTITSDASAVTVDLTPPTLSTARLRSSNATTTVAKAGDVITLTFTSSETILPPVVVLAGQAVTATNTSGNTWTASATVSAVTSEGGAALSVAFSDLAGNAGTTVTATTDTSAVTVDLTPPTFSVVQFSSSNAVGSVAKNGDTLTLILTASETIRTPVVTINGQTTTISFVSGNTWTARTTVTPTMVEGLATLVATFSDVAGNAGTAVTATTDASTVTVDLRVPALVSVHLASSNSNPSFAKAGDTLMLTFQATEKIQTPAVVLGGRNAALLNLSGNTWRATTVITASTHQGSATFSFGFSDIAGNGGIPVSATSDASGVVVDLTPPSLTAVHLTSANATSTLAKSGDVLTVTFIASEALLPPAITLAGLSATAVNVSGNQWTASVTVVGDTAEGNVTLSLAYNDLAGNAGAAVNSPTDGSGVLIDQTAPVLTVVHLVSSNLNSRYAKTGDTLTLSFTASEPILTPVVTLVDQNGAVTVQSVGGNQWIATQVMVAGAPQGMMTFFVTFVDHAGNLGTPVTGTTDASSVTIDNLAPQVITSPLPDTVNPGATASFDVDASSISPASYQWRKNTIVIEGATSPTFSITPAAETDEGSYDCVVTNIAGSSTSAAAILSVNDPIVITSPPLAVTVNQNEPASFTVSATGTLPVTYQWRKNGVNLPAEMSATLQLSSSQVSDQGNYDVVVANIVGSKTTSTAFLTVLGGAPRITRQPAPRTVEPESPVAFNVTVVGASPLTYQWRKNAVNIPGATSTIYSIASTVATDAAAYSVKITNSAGSVISDAATLTVKTATYVFTTQAGLAGVAGTTNGTSAAARFSQPSHMVRDSVGNFFITDKANAVIREIAVDGTVTTFAGVAGSPGTANGTGTAARFMSPEGIGMDASNNLYVADNAANTIRCITSAGEVTTLAGDPAKPAGSANGIGTGATFSGPRGIAVTAAGIVYVSEGGGHTVRQILPDGTVSTLAGLAGSSGTADGSGSIARFNRPAGLALDAAGNVYVADELNHAIRKISSAGVVTTVAGLKGAAGKVDGTGTVARFQSPAGIAVDGAGVIFVADTGNDTLRSISLLGAVRTLGGLAGTQGTANGMGSLARFRLPQGIALSPVGDLYITDTANQTLRKGTLEPLPEITTQPQSLLVGLGQTAAFTVAADGSPPLTYQWRKNAANIAATESSAKTSAYTTPATTLTSAGTYTALVSNAAGSVVSAGARLGVVNVTSSTVIVNETTTLALTVSAAGDSLTYEWRKDGLPVPNGGRVSGATTSKLVITKAVVGDAGAYACVVRMGALELASGTSTVSVRVRPMLNTFAPTNWIASGLATDSVIPLDVSALNKPTSYAVKGLPTGMTFNTATGQFGGRPNVPGTYTLLITATNAAGVSDVQKAVIVIAPLPVGAVGTFNGLLDRDATLTAPVATSPGLKLQGHGGSLYNLVITSAGTFTGTLNLEDRSYAMPGGSRLEAVAGQDPTAAVTLVRGKTNDAIADLSFTFSISQDTGNLQGHVTDGQPGSTPIPVQAWRNPWKTTGTVASPALPATALAGNYTALLELDPSLRDFAQHPDRPQGSGYLTLTLTKAGLATWGGQLADGTAVTGGTTLGPGGEVPLHLMLYTPTVPVTAGSAHGWVYATADSATPLNRGKPLLNGTLDWDKLAQATTSTTRSYKSGFPLQALTVKGGFYDSSLAVTTMLGLPSSTTVNNATLTFSEADLVSSSLAKLGSPAGRPAGTLNQALLITGANAVSMPAGITNNPGGVSLKLYPATGLFTGGFSLKDYDPTLPSTVVPRVVTWSGVLVPRLTQGVGHFQLPQLPSASPVRTTATTSPILSGQAVLSR